MSENVRRATLITAIVLTCVLVCVAVASADQRAASLLQGSSDAVRFATYLGGEGNETGYSIAVGQGGDVYIAGDTTSQSFAETAPNRVGPGGSSDAFVAKLSSDGAQLEYAIVFGGTDRDFASSLTVGADGTVYVVGSTYSADFPTVDAFQDGNRSCHANGCSPDAFVVEVDPSGSSLNFSSYLGGRSRDLGVAIGLSAAGSMWLGGDTTSRNFPTTSNAFQTHRGGGVDAFLLRVSANHKLDLGTYVGGSNDEHVGSLTYGSRKVAVVGTTSSSDFPVVRSRQKSVRGTTDAFVTTLNGSNGEAVYSTLIGGSSLESGLGIDIDNGRVL
ncbi:MAG: hypothetical protein M3290_01305, partial [Actinomycetota bacterium]|nr:hypothetical protein [Actinomycetota bacterium]